MSPPLSPQDSPSSARTGTSRSTLWIAALVGLAVVMILVFRPSGSGGAQATGSASSASSTSSTGSDSSADRSGPRPVTAPGSGLVEPSAEERVAQKLERFVQHRREVVRAIAEHRGVAVPKEVEEFYTLAAAGRWDEAHALYGSLSESRSKGEGRPDLLPFFPALLETVGVHEAVRDWPALALLNYGQAVLGTLPPGAIYFGGTDSGRFIPTLLNEDSGKHSPIVMTQNALADNTYLEYTAFLYRDRLNALASEDSQHAFQDYMADASARLAHDQAHPDEPKQIRPGEDIRSDDGRVIVSGQLAVMSINERLLQALMAKNPEAAVFLEESFPLTGAYGGATPEGPLLRLRGQSDGTALTTEQASQAVTYWQDTTQQLLADPDASGSTEVRNAYAKLLLAQADLLASGALNSQAEETFRLAQELAPSNPEVATRYLRLLSEQNRQAEALPWLEALVQEHPDQEALRGLLDQVKSAKRP